MIMSMQEIKKLFMAYRNGIVADTLRSAGMNCYSVIFGLNLPQLSAIARQITETHDRDAFVSLADALWADKAVRESRLLALHLYGSSQEMPRDMAERLMGEILTREEGEVMCLRLLRNLPYARQLVMTEVPDDPLQAHLHAVLRRHLEQ